MRDRAGTKRGISLEIPGVRKLRISHAVFDFNGTLATDGRLIAGVGARLRHLAHIVDVIVMRADTFGTAHAALRALPVSIQTVRTGADKGRLVRGLRGGVATIGNGRNDVTMFRSAALAVAVIGTEGAVPALLRAATVVVHDIKDALDLLLESKRLVATLRR